MVKCDITIPPGVPQIIITAEVDAPRVLVYRAYPEPELLVQWLGPRHLSMTVERLEVRDGGRWHFTNSDLDGNAYAFHGVFHGQQSPERMVRTFEYEGAPAHVSLETLTIEKREGRSYLSANAVYESVEDRDAMMQGGMEDGVRQGFERLEELLGRLMQGDTGAGQTTGAEHAARRAA